MTKEEAKQYIRNQINSCVKKQHPYNKHIYRLCYNKQYLRALKFSKITGNPVNKEDFKEGDILFMINATYKTFRGYSIIQNYLIENYSTSYSEQIKLLDEVINEYEEYKDYKGL